MLISSIKCPIPSKYVWELVLRNHCCSQNYLQIFLSTSNSDLIVVIKLSQNIVENRSYLYGRVYRYFIIHSVNSGTCYLSLPYWHLYLSDLHLKCFDYFISMDSN